MRTVYLPADMTLPDDLRADLMPCRFENAGAFANCPSVSPAIVYGDYPEVESALTESGIDFEVREVPGDDVPVEADSSTHEDSSKRYKVMKIGNSRASKVDLTEAEALSFIEQNGADDYDIQPMEI